MFKTGQRVVCKVGNFVADLGTVIAHDSDGSYPIKVKFDNGSIECFTSSGKIWLFSNDPCLFPTEEAEPIEQPNALPQDFITELKALLEKYDGVIGTENGQDELYVSGGGKYVRVYKGSMGSDDL